MSGGLPAALGSLVNLKTIALADNELSGELPNELGNLIKLETLNLVPQLWQPTEWRDTGILRQPYQAWRCLSLYDNNLRGEIPTGLSTLVNLRKLYLGYNELTGEIPIWLGSLAELRHLYLENTNSGGIPATLSNLESSRNFVKQ